MKSISVSYTPKYELDFTPQYKWSECNKCFNTKTGREIIELVNEIINEN